MHAAVHTADPTRSEHLARPRLNAPVRRALRSEATLWVAALLFCVSITVVDGLVASIVAFERDTVVFYYPLMEWVGQQLKQGNLPLWTPQVFGGYPIFADGEIGLAYPPALLALLVLPPDKAFILLRLAHLWLAALGMFALARTWRLPYSSATLAGLVFALGSFLAAQIHHENIIRTATWLPAILALIECALRTDQPRARVRFTLLAAVGFGFAGVALHSQMLAIDLLILGLYAAFRLVVGPIGGGATSWLRRIGTVAAVCGAVVATGLLLAAVQLIPLIELAGFSLRGSGIPYSESAAYSLTPYGLAQTIFPYVFRAADNKQWGLWTHWESYLYVGLVPLVLAVVGLACARGREVAGWGVLALIGLILALGQYSPLNLHYVLWLLPGLSGLRAPGRFTIMVVLALGMLAAYGLAWLQSGSFDRARLQRVLLVLGIVVGGLAVGIAAVHVVLRMDPSVAAGPIQQFYLALPRDTYTLTVPDVLTGLLWATSYANVRMTGALLGLALVLGGLWAWRCGPWPRVRAWVGWPALWVGLTAIDLLVFGWSIHPREPLSRLAAEPGAARAIEQQPAPDGVPNRVLTSPVLNQVAPDRLAPFTLQEAGGYSSLEFVWHRDLLNRVQYVDDGLLDLWNVRYVLDTARYGSLANFNGVTFLPSQALLQAPVGSALGEQRFALAPSSSISELRLVTALVGAVDVAQDTPVAQVELRDAADQVVATAELLAGRDTMDWASDLPSVQPYVQHRPATSAGVAFEGTAEPRARQLSYAGFTYDRPVTASSVVVRAIPPRGELVLFGAAAVSPDGTLQNLFGRTKAKFRQIYIDNDVRVLENTAALPRAFLVPEAHVASSQTSALSEMIHGRFAPDREVVLTANGVAPDEAPRGGSGSAAITAYGTDAVQIHTSASAPSWLVLSDTYYPGWTATVDGQAAPIYRGDVLFRVVPVPGGEHDVVFTFTPQSLQLGFLISLATLAAVGVGLLLAGRPPRRARTTSVQG